MTDTEEPQGWRSSAPDIVASTHTLDPFRELTIDREPGGQFTLTVLDPVEECGQSSVHSTIEDAKREAAHVVGDPNLRWLMQRS